MVDVVFWDCLVGVGCGWVDGGVVVVDVLVAFAGVVIVGMSTGIVVCAERLSGGVSISISIDTWGTGVSGDSELGVKMKYLIVEEVVSQMVRMKRMWMMN